MTADWYQIFTTDLILNGSDFAQLALTLNGNSRAWHLSILMVAAAAVASPEGPGGPGRGCHPRSESGTLDCIDSLNCERG